MKSEKHYNIFQGKCFLYTTLFVSYHRFVPFRVKEKKNNLHKSFQFGLPMVILIRMLQSFLLINFSPPKIPYCTPCVCFFVCSYMKHKIDPNKNQYQTHRKEKNKCPKSTLVSLSEYVQFDAWWKPKRKGKMWCNRL